MPILNMVARPEPNDNPALRRKPRFNIAALAVSLPATHATRLSRSLQDALAFCQCKLRNLAQTPQIARAAASLASASGSPASARAFAWSRAMNV